MKLDSIKQAIVSLPLCIVVFGSCNSVDPDAHNCEVATWANFSTAAVSYTFDDDLPNQFAIALPILDKYGVKGTFYPTGKEIDNWDVLRQCAENGHEIGSHTVNHYALNSLDADTLESELKVSKDNIEANISCGKCLSIAYPFCIMPDTSVVAKHYIAARVCDRRIEPATPSNYYGISSWGIGSESTYVTAQSVVDIFKQARDSAGWCVLLIHEIDEGFGYSPYSSAALDSTLSYLVDNSDVYWTATFADVVKYTRERDMTKIALVDESEDMKVLSFTNALDKTIYDINISVRCPLPDGWNGAVVEQEHSTCNSYLKDGFVYFDIRPNGGDVILSKE